MAGLQERKPSTRSWATLLKDHHYWINLILAYTGHGDPIAGLLAGDVGEENGIPFVHIRPNHLRGLDKTASAAYRFILI